MKNGHIFIVSGKGRTLRVLSLALFLFLLLSVETAASPLGVSHGSVDGMELRYPLRKHVTQAREGYSTSGADTIWVGYLPGSRSPSNPYGIGVGGVWDFDAEVTGTDSSQFWQFHLLDWRFGSTTVMPYPSDRPIWYFDHGNGVNNGNTNLWLDRESRGMHAQNTGPAHTAGYLRTGITGYWHVDNMIGVSSPINGANSAWCGLRGPGDLTYRDEVTGNALNGDQARHWTLGGVPGEHISGSWPGYGDQIEQILYRDVTLSHGDGSDVLSFSFRTDMSDLPATDSNGSAWFNPEPTSMDHFVLDPVDSLMVWVGLPQDDKHYDTNKRWLSEVIDFDSTNQPEKLFAQSGKAPQAGGDSTVTENLPAWGSGTRIRLAFQVKTNRMYSDETYRQQHFDSADGAALIDDVVINGAVIGDFETGNEIRPRMSLPGGGVQVENDPMAYWITTGKPPAGYGHIESVFDLPYNDPCGALGSPDRFCNLYGNVILLSDHDDPDHAFFRESWVGAESPTIDISPGSPLRLAGVGDPNHDAISIEYDVYTGYMYYPDTAVFWQTGARYHGPSFLQGADELAPGWSDNVVGPWIQAWPETDPVCFLYSLYDELDYWVPRASELDSLKIFVWTITQCTRFGAQTLCGKPQGGYFDRVRVGFTENKEHGLVVRGFSDAFPFSEDVPPGSTDFDTTTVLVKSGTADTLMAATLFEPAPGIQTRVDLVFRILPGPGNYSDKGNRETSLLKVPSNPSLGNAAAGDGSFWGQYLLDNGPFGSTPSGHTGTFWNQNTWNSARMDSAESNLSPVVEHGHGVPASPYWMGTYHEEDPNYIAFGISRNICFLVNPQGVANDLNVCCSAAECTATPFFEPWPPISYPIGTPTTTIEGTKILPDGIFTPGTHVEYFVRRADSPAGLSGVRVVPDTTRMFWRYTDDGEYTLGGFRFGEFGVFPDLWKDLRFKGRGLACMFVTAQATDQHTVLGALDSLGYGKNNGAGRGWWENDYSASNPPPEDPDNWVFTNQGQLGLAFDWFNSGPDLGCRLAVVPPEIGEKKYKTSPTPAMLKYYYKVLLWLAFYEPISPLNNGVDQECNSVALIQNFLDSSSSGNKRAVWLAGEAVADYLQNSGGNAPELLSTYFATVHEASTYRVASGNRSGLSAVVSLIPEFSAPRAYGFSNHCYNASDVISVNGAVPGGVLAARYEDASDGDASINPGQYGAAVYRPADNMSRFYTTLITAFPPYYLRGVGFENSTTDFGRIAFIDDVLKAFNLCSSIGPVIAIGDIPGADGRLINFVRGAFPNPSTKGDVTIQFDLVRPSEVAVRFYNVAGRLVHEANLDGVAGPNTLKWDGHSSTGIPVAPGVYFYRLAAPGAEFQGNDRRMVILSAGRN